MVRSSTAQEVRPNVERSRTILIVDDVPLFRELGALFLARTGRVITAASGEEALECVHRHRPSLVVSDFQMPDMPGDELCRAIKADSEVGETPVILVLSRADVHHRGRAVRAGADDILTKPLSRTSLIAAVTRFLHYDVLRGLPRVELETPIALQLESETKEHWGTVRNLSRGGVFVETPEPLDRSTEVSLRFRLPETDAELESTAEVVWTRRKGRHPLEAELPPGMGLRFLELDRREMESLDDYVFERAEAHHWTQPGETS